ncbi:mechanosensitive ion channel family protein [Mesorhizobium sp. L-8-3]|uniref:mechanosensitive ion channel family protein n=1 Tax=Mesorhizobium sp. L-8-3 TaxID=2744522 RepID=UPI001927F1CB|nr:mechanosensitive ion channel family protein [Mesorhizobium sp. L-8-3]
MTSEDVRALANRMSETEFRQFVLERLGVAQAKPTPPPPAETGDLASEGQRLVAGLGDRLLTAVVGLPVMWDRTSLAVSTFVGKLGWNGLGRFLLGVAGAFGAGIAAELLVDRLASRLRRHASRSTSTGTLGETLSILGARLALDMFGLIAFLVVTRAVGRALIAEDLRPIAAQFLFYCVITPRFTAAFLRFLFAPTRPGLRLVSIDDRNAKFLYRNLVGIIVFLGAAIFLINFIIANGISIEGTALGFWPNLLVFAWLGWTIFHARSGVAMMSRGWEADVTPMEDRVARAYPWFDLALIAASWLVFELVIVGGNSAMLESGKQYLTLGILLLAPTMDTMIRGLVRHLIPPMQGQGAVAEKAYLSTKRSYIRIGRVMVFGLVVLVIAVMWDLSISSFTSNQVGLRLAARLFTFLMILAAGYLVWEISTLLFNRRIAGETAPEGIDLQNEDAGEITGTAGSRMTTVLPLLRMGTQAAIIVLTILVALSNLGIDITPLVAGAGIVGLAVGFGAQTLVKDIVSGVFFLIDDAFRVGEYIVVGSTAGTVEKISVRSLQLRHPQGAVHTIPYGEIGQVTNNSRDWVVVKMKFTVPFDTDVNKIRKIFKQIGNEIMDAPYADDIIQTFKSQGVSSVDDVGLLVRGKFMSKPGKQWSIRKDIYSRVQTAFAAAGIEFARREVRVSMPRYQDLTDSERQAIATSAAQAALAKG